MMREVVLRSPVRTWPLSLRLGLPKRYHVGACWHRGAGLLSVKRVDNKAGRRCQVSLRFCALETGSVGAVSPVVVILRNLRYLDVVLVWLFVV